MVERFNEHKFGFEKLDVWNNSIIFVQQLYNLTEQFPKHEIYCLTSQIRRAAISIPSNIAEGSTRNSLKDQARFTEIAFGSLIEVLNQLMIANKLNYINEEILNSMRLEIEKITNRKINGKIKTFQPFDLSTVQR